MGPKPFSLALRPGLKRLGEQLEREGVGVFAHTGDTSLGLMGLTVNTVRATAFPRRELDNVGVVVNPTKTVVLPPKGHAPTTKEIALLERDVDVRIVGEGGVLVVGVPIGVEKCLVKRAMGVPVVRDGSADRLVRCLADMGTSTQRPSFPSNPSGRGLTVLKGFRWG